MMSLEEMSKFDWGVLKCGVPESEQFYIGNLPMYTFLISTHPYNIFIHPCIKNKKAHCVL